MIEVKARGGRSGRFGAILSAYVNDRELESRGPTLSMLSYESESSMFFQTHLIQLVAQYVAQRIFLATPGGAREGGSCGPSAQN